VRGALAAGRLADLNWGIQEANMYYDLSREQKRLRKQMQACHQALIELEASAGIAQAAEQLRSAPPEYFYVYDVGERDSDERRDAVAREEWFHAEHTARRIRELYFAVHDVVLRKALVAKVREEENLGVRFWQEELSDAAVRHKAAQAPGVRWWLVASLWGICLIGLGFFLFGIIGAMAGLLVGYFSGRSLEHSARRARESAIAKAEEELKEAQDTWDKTRNEPLTFSRDEARTGEPDEEPPGLRRASPFHTANA
jgi:hypothetical protein